ncbi:MAG: acyl-CoA dehydrogenase family protein [Solirubrobacteraceae bacterium]
MRFAFTEDQDELRRTVRGFLERHATATIVRAAAESGDGLADEAWARLVAEMELTSLAIGLERGGAGASFVEVGVALEELGRTLLPVPYLPTVVAAAALEHADSAAARSLLERIVAGAAATIALEEPGAGLLARGAGEDLRVDGLVEHVLDGAHAELLLIAAELDGEPALLAVQAGADGVAVEPHTTLDQTRRQASVRLTGARAVRISSPGEGAALLDRARDVLAVALAVECVGAAARCLELTVSYLKERVQFGRPIGSFQALKHRCADLAVALESARSTAYYAMWAVDGAPEELPILAPLAQAVCVEAFALIAAETIQLHGGIGFTWEHDAHLYFKRAKATELLGGGTRAQRRLVGVRAGLTGGPSRR